MISAVSVILIPKKVDGNIVAWVVVGLNSCSSSSVSVDDSEFSSINS